MKKVIIIMMAVLLATLLVVSCKADVKAQEDRLSSVTVDSDASRGFTSTIASNVDPIDSLDWYYTAVKTDGGLFVTGQKTELTAIGTGNSLGQLSFGTWSFTFKLVKHGAGSSAAAVYEGSLTGVSINQEVTNLHVHLNQGNAVGTAKVVFDALSFDVGNLAINNTQGGVFKLEVMENNTAIFATAGSDAYDNGVAFDLTSLTSGSLEGAYDVAGAHTYEFIVSYKPASGSLADTWTEVTRTQYTVYIPLGITMTISGSVEAIESTSAVTATGSIHHYAIDDVGAWYCYYSDCNQLLAGTDAAYITVLDSDGQPTEIIPLADSLHRGIGSGTIDVSGNNVTYENTSGVAQTVVIRTTSSDAELTITAGTDVVKHYDYAGSLTINAIAGNSYHENGSVAFVEIKTGRIVLESNSDVEHIHLTATAGATSSDAYFDGITVAKASTVEMPEFSRDAVEIPDEGRLVVALQDGTESTDAKDYVWLTAVGVYEQVTVSNSATDAGNNYAANLTAEADQEKKDTAQQIANSITFSEGGNDYKVTAATTDGGQTWTYNVVDTATQQATSAYSAREEDNVVTVTDVSTSQSVETTVENGTEIEEKKSEFVPELISTDSELRAFLASNKLKGKLANNISNPTVETKATRYVYANGRDVELDLAGNTLDGYEICVDDGSTFTLTGNGIVNLDDEEAVVIYNGSLVLAGAKITGNPESSAPLSFSNYDSTNGEAVECSLIIADDTVNYIETSADSGSGIMVVAYYGDMNLNIIGQEKHNGQLLVTAKTEDAWAAIRPYQGGANSKTVIDGLYIELSTESGTYEVIDGTGNVQIKTVTGSFSGNVTEYCQAGYCSKLNSETGRYEIGLLTEEDATFRITSSTGAETLIAGSIYQAMALATEGSTITVLKDCNITEAAWNAPGAGADYFTIDLNEKTISGNDLSIKRPDPRNSDNVTMPVHVTIKNGTMSNGLMFYTYTYATLNNIDFVNTTSSYAEAIRLNSNIKTNVYDWAAPGTNSLSIDNCRFSNKSINLYGSNEGQRIDLTMTGCSLTKTLNGNGSMIKANYYVHGTISLNGCTLNGAFNNSYTYPVEIGSASSSNGANPVTLNLNNVSITVTGSSKKPVSIGSSWTVNETGSNSYSVESIEVRYNGDALV